MNSSIFSSEQRKASGVPMLDRADATPASDERSGRDRHSEAEIRRQWRNWLKVLLSCLIVGSGLFYAAVVLIDPFSTGRFALTQRIDFASRNSRLAKAGLVRDLQSDSALFGDSTGFPLDPSNIVGQSGGRMVQLTIPAALPADILTVARAFERHHAGRQRLEVFVLSDRWCKSIGPSDQAFGPFPTWLYESSGAVYLSRIFFPEAVETATLRLAIWLGLAEQTMRADGYAPEIPIRDPALAQSSPMNSGPPADAPFPAIDVLAAHLAALPDGVRLGLVFAPVYVKVLPASGSMAAARLEACKARIRKIAAQRPRTGYLDLMTDNPISRQIDNYQDGVHYNLEAARPIERRIATMVEQIDVSRK
jgi:hypothetical protein